MSTASDKKVPQPRKNLVRDAARSKTVAKNQKSKNKQRFMAQIVFSGDLEPDVKGAIERLRKAGYEVHRFPKRFRRILDHPKDDFLQVLTLWPAGGSPDTDYLDPMINNMWRAMWRAVDDIVQDCEGMCELIEIVDEDWTPFADLYAHDGANVVPFAKRFPQE
jgi:hypothetical protein